MLIEYQLVAGGFLFLFMDYEILQIQLHGFFCCFVLFSHGFDIKIYILPFFNNGNWTKSWSILMHRISNFCTAVALSSSGCKIMKIYEELIFFLFMHRNKTISDKLTKNPGLLMVTYGSTCKRRWFSWLFSIELFSFQVNLLPEMLSEVCLTNEHVCYKTNSVAGWMSE